MPIPNDAALLSDKGQEVHDAWMALAGGSGSGFAGTDGTLPTRTAAASVSIATLAQLASMTEAFAGTSTLNALNTYRTVAPVTGDTPDTIPFDVSLGPRQYTAAAAASAIGMVNLPAGWASGAIGGWFHLIVKAAGSDTAITLHAEDSTYSDFVWASGCGNFSITANTYADFFIWVQPIGDAGGEPRFVVWAPLAITALDADLTAIGALTSAANKLPYATGAQTWAMADFTAAGRALVDDADAAAQRTTLGAGTPSIPLTSVSAAKTFVLGEANQGFLHPAADTTARTWTIDSNANVAYPVGTILHFVNQNAAGVLTIAITTDTMRLAGAGTTGSRSIAANGVVTAQKIATTEWIIYGTGLT